jgi:hypothetical protein
MFKKNKMKRSVKVDKYNEKEFDMIYSYIKNNNIKNWSAVGCSIKYKHLNSCVIFDIHKTKFRKYVKATLNTTVLIKECGANYPGVILTEDITKEIKDLYSKIKNEADKK